MNIADHPDADRLEAYVLGRLRADEPTTAHIEEHLLVCPHCVSRTEEALEFTRALRAALVDE